MRLLRPGISIVCLFLVVALPANGQQQQVTFRWIPDGQSGVVRAFLPGDFNDWGPDLDGLIDAEAPSLMTFDEALDQWLYSINLNVGATHSYKVHLHNNASGSNNTWISDPLNDRLDGTTLNNSVVTITDPMVFQPAQQVNSDRLVYAVSAGLFTSSSLTEITFWINGAEQDGMPFFNPETRVFYHELATPVRQGSLFKIRVTNAAGEQDSLSIGEVQNPLVWITPSFQTVSEEVIVEASVTRQDGTVDSTITEAEIFYSDLGLVVPVQNGRVSEAINLDLGENKLVLFAEVQGQRLESDTLRLTRFKHPMDRYQNIANVAGSNFEVNVSIEPAPGYVPPYPGFIYLDTLNSTTKLENAVLRLDGRAIGGTATGPGELYFNAGSDFFTGEQDTLRIGVIVEDDGTVRQMRYEETPSWVKNAVVYEIFPLSFGPEASGNRFNEIRENLDYIAEMGFNVIWFMPIFKNQIMDQVSGGYNIVDFYNVDPKLGTNEDFKALVDRAHELGLKIILDITPSHVSPAHPWVDALKTAGNATPPGSHIQTSPSPHNKGQDNRGANLSEVWQGGGGISELYRKYEGFGDLANVDWDSDDLQAAMLDIFAHWVQVYNIDGWRIDVYWGPWRRYGLERFGRPLREHLKRIKPDQWILGEIVGTGFSTEVYYADDDTGTSVAGGIDAGYDWPFYYDAIGADYGSILTYDDKAKNGGFWPGPNARYFRFLENHDEDRIAQRFANNPEQILPLTTFLLTTTGIPMVYQGQEVNCCNTGSWPARQPVTWDTPLNETFARHHRRLNLTRTQFAAFGTQDLQTLSTSDNVYAYVRPMLDENAVVAINFAGSPRTVTLNPTSVVETTTDGPIVYHDLFNGTSFTDAELDGFSVTLNAYESVVWIANGGGEVEFNEPAELPDLPFGANYSTSNENTEVSGAETNLYTNYPNPFSSQTTLAITLENPGVISLEVFDILGRRVATVADGFYQDGGHQFVFNGTSLPSGVYLVRLQTRDEEQSHQMVISR